MADNSETVEEVEISDPDRPSDPPKRQIIRKKTTEPKKRDDKKEGEQDAEGKQDEAKPKDGKKDDAQKDDGKKDDDPKKPKSKRPFIIFAIVLLIAAIGGIIWYINASHYETTDDAQVNTHLSALSSRVEGTVMNVYVEENQFVKAGQVIADLDPQDYQVALNNAQSQLAEARAQVATVNPNVPITQTSNNATVSSTQADLANSEAGVAAAEGDYQAALADLREAEANSNKAQADVLRYQPLAAKDEVPREQFDQVVATAKAQAAAVESRRATADVALKVIDQRKASLEQTRVRLKEAQQNAPRQVAIRKAEIASRQTTVKTTETTVERARLDLAYTKIYAPVSGIISRRSVEVGQHVTAGQQMVQIARTDDLWVTADFKETQLLRMRPGQRVTIHVDAFQRDFNGHIQSLPASTGAITSLLPPENATGNYVKTTQRLGIRIRFEPNQDGLERLRPGMSVEPKVWLD